MSDKKGWVQTGSIVDMLEQEGICYFKQDGGKVQVGSVDEFSMIMLHPEMLRHLANELNEMADTLERNEKE